jgi:Domain of unknown function (DUF4062)
VVKKFQVFISSTFRDLVDERQDTIRSVLDLGHIPSGMEIFPATDVQQFEYIKKIIDECDYYVLIIGARYGSVDSEGVSFTEKEYAYAVENGVPVLAFIHGDVGSLPVSRSDTEPAVVERLNKFRATVAEGRLVRFWRTRDELKAQVIVSLAKATSEIPGIGWIRGDAVASEQLLAQINTLRNENDDLRLKVTNLTVASMPSFKDLADLDSVFPLRIFVYNAAGSDFKRSIDITWREIFRAVAPSFTSPKWVSSISGALKTHITENRSINVTFVFDTDEDTIKMQLVAYGLLRVYSAPRSGGGSGEAAELTTEGRRQLMEIMVVRKPK